MSWPSIAAVLADANHHIDMMFIIRSSTAKLRRRREIRSFSAVPRYNHSALLTADDTLLWLIEIPITHHQTNFYVEALG